MFSIAYKNNRLICGIVGLPVDVKKICVFIEKFNSNLNFGDYI